MPVLFFILWMILNGRITAELVIIGILVSAIVTYIAHVTVGYTLAGDLRRLRLAPYVIRYLATLFWEILKAAGMVLRTIYHADEPEPVFVEFHSGLHGNLANVVLANSITLTPGTITVFQEGDHFLIHCLHPEYAEGIEECSFVRILRNMQSVMKEAA